MDDRPITDHKPLLPDAVKPTDTHHDGCPQPRPDWVPDEAGPGFATWILEGARPASAPSTGKPVPRRILDPLLWVLDRSLPQWHREWKKLLLGTGR